MFKRPTPPERNPCASGTHRSSKRVKPQPD
jgi:hypothetical protein